jgi:hypothetical protein
LQFQDNSGKKMARSLLNRKSLVWFRSVQSKSETFFAKAKKARGMAQVVKYLPSKYKALNSNPVIHSVPDPSLLKDFVEPTSLGLSILRCSAQFCVFIDITV